MEKDILLLFMENENTKIPGLVILSRLSGKDLERKYYGTRMVIPNISV